VDKNPFLVNTIDLQNSKVLIWPEQAEAAKCKNVVIGEKHTITANEKILSREVVVEKTVNGKESLKITIKALTLGGGGGQAQAKIVEETTRQPEALQLVRPVHTIGQTGLARGAPSTISQTGSSYQSNRLSSPWMAENLQAKESREGEMEIRWRRLSVQEIQGQANFWSPIEQVYSLGGCFMKLAKRETSKVPSKVGNKQNTAEGGHSAERGSTTWAPFGCSKCLIGDKPSHESKFEILSSVPSDGTICWSTNVAYTTSAAAPVLGVGSSCGYVGAISSDVDAAVSSGLGHLSDQCSTGWSCQYMTD
jgi:hypothetical protein